MMHMHTPPKVFIQAWIKLTQRQEGKLGAYVNQEIRTQNITEKK